MTTIASDCNRAVAFATRDTAVAREQSQSASTRK
jgi:hypothetical protein